MSLAESIAFAVALDVSPVSLFLPLTRADDIQLAPAHTADVETAYQWIRGDHPLNEKDRDAVAFYRFQSP